MPLSAIAAPTIMADISQAPPPVTAVTNTSQEASSEPTTTAMANIFNGASRAATAAVNISKGSPHNAFDSESELDTRIQALPQELQDSILTFTDAFHIPAIVTVTDSYKLPVALQLTSKIRNKFAKQYYSRAIFKWRAPRPHQFFHQFVHPGKFAQWLQHLGSIQLSMLRNIEVLMDCWGRFDPVYTVECRRLRGKRIRRCLLEAGHTSGTRVTIGVTSKEGEGSLEWMWFDEAGELL